LKLTVGMSEFAVSTDPDDVLITYSLGSCLGVAVHDPVAGVGGLLHSMMPTAKADPEKALAMPAMYTDTGVAALLQAMFDLGSRRRDLVAKVAGGGSNFDKSSVFRVGERNYMVLRRILWKNGIFIAAEDVGGSSSRTISLEVGSGLTLVKSGTQTMALTAPTPERK
jgi:chemotaxis protein CheD